MLWLESGLGQIGRVLLWRKMPFPLGWQAFYMACLQLLSIGERIKLQQEWPPHFGLLKAPSVLKAWGFGSWRALTSHLWVPRVGRGFQGWAQVSRVYPPFPLSPASSGQGPQGSLGMTCCRRHSRQGASLPGRLCCIPVVIAAPFPSHTRKVASK